MNKLFVLIFIIFLALLSISGYLILSKKISSWQQKIEVGQKQLAMGQKKLDAGKVKLANGKAKYLHVKKIYRKIHDTPLAGIATSLLPSSDLVFQQAKRKIAEEGYLIANGESRVKDGESQIAAGKLELSQRVEQLKFVNRIRIACGIAAGFFTLLAIVLGYCWRRKK